jgi:hypothetical protein
MIPRFSLNIPCGYNQQEASHTQGGMRIGKKPKKQESICCPQHRETNAETLKQQRPIGEGDQEPEKRSV